MENDITVMPFSLAIRTYESPYGDIYTSKGEQLVETKEEMSHGRKAVNYIDYDNSSYLECINICSVSDAVKFMKDYPNLRFMLVNTRIDGRLLLFDYAPRIDKRLLLSDYARRIEQAIIEYHQMNRLGDVLEAYHHSPDNDHLLEICNAYLNARSFRIKIGDDILVRSTRDIRLFRDLLMKVVQSQQSSEDEANTVVKTIQSRYNDYINSIISEADIRFDPSNLRITYVCDTVLTAMYMHRYAAQFNKEEYKKCAEPGCNTYFLVDRKHPQSRCPEHMLARQNKRKKQKMREKENERYAWEHINDE